MSTRSYLSIGDVLSLLREEFPDVTISKIRFLESQGLVDPERSPSGYRKFYDHDVDRLRWVLRQQRDQFLPLKVIRDRLAAAGDGVPADEPEDMAPSARPASGDREEEAWTNGAAPSAPEAAAGPRREVAASERAQAASAHGPAGAPGTQGADAWRRAGAEGANVVRLDSDRRQGGAGHPAGPASGGSTPMAATPVDATAGPAGRDAPAHPTADRPSHGGPPGTQDPQRVAAAAEAGSRAGGGRASQGPAASADAAHPTGAHPTPGLFAHMAAQASGEQPRGAGAGAGGGAGGGSGGPSRTPERPEPPEPHQGREAADHPGRPPAGSSVPGAAESTAHVLSGSVSGVSLSPAELSAATGLSAQTLATLTGFGLIAPMAIAGDTFYDEEALTVAKLVAEFAKFGIEPRHLRLYRNAVDREVGLVEQVITPLLRQRNPEARQRALDAAAELTRLGQGLRAALVRTELRRQFGG